MAYAVRPPSSQVDIERPMPQFLSSGGGAYDSIILLAIWGQKSPDYQAYFGAPNALIPSKSNIIAA